MDQLVLITSGMFRNPALPLSSEFLALQALPGQVQARVRGIEEGT